MSRPAILIILAGLLAACAPADEPSTHQLAASREAPMTIFDEEPEDCLKLIPGLNTFADPTGLLTDFEMRDAHLGFAVDASFVEFFGDAWQQNAEEIIAIMDEFYEREVSISIETVHLVSLPVDVRELDNNTDPQAVMDALIAAYEAAHGDTPRDSVQFFLGADVAGAVAGLANCIGGAGFPSIAYVWGEAYNREPISLGPVGLFNDQAAKIAVHEFGHMMAGHHHYSNCADGAAGLSPDDINAVCGVMNNFADFAGNVFSTPNRLAIRSWADQVDL